MENFTIYNPVKVHFGTGVINKLGQTILTYGNRVMLVYGKGSIKRNGIYDQVISILNEAGCMIVEYSGIKSNPLIEDVDAAATLGKNHNIDVVLAVGGGSVIDSAKVIAAAIPANVPAWSLVDRSAKSETSLPVIAVLTLAATGSEMNQFAVVQNNKLDIKTSFATSHSFPVHSFLDPAYTISVPADYTGYGIVDLVAHALEAWFGKGDSPLADKVVISIIEEAIDAGIQLMDNLQNYSLRARIMYASTLALNGTCMHGRASGDWGVHDAGHVLSLLFDLPHGASLSIVYPAWLKLMKHRDNGRIAKLVFQLFYTDDINDGIYKLEYFFKLLKSPVRLSETNIPASGDKDIVKQMIKNKVSGLNYQLDEKDYKALVALMR